MDVAAIEPGRDFRKAIDKSVASCSVLLAVIGRVWLETKDDAGSRRLDDPNDFVRIELASALRRDIPVVPVLVRAAKQEDALRMSTELGHQLTPAPENMKIMGPAEAPVPRLKAEFRYQLLIKSEP